MDLNALFGNRPTSFWDVAGSAFQPFRMQGVSDGFGSMRPQRQESYPNPIQQDWPIMGPNPELESEPLDIPQFQSEQSNPLLDMLSRLGKEPESINLFRSLISQMPQRRNPSFSDKFSAGTVGALTALGGGPHSGVALTTEMLDRPYNQEMEDWKGRLGATGTLAGLDVNREGRSNSAMLNLLGQMRLGRETDAKLENINADNLRADNALEELKEHRRITREQGEKRIGLEGQRVSQGERRTKASEKRSDAYVDRAKTKKETRLPVLEQQRAYAAASREVAKKYPEMFSEDKNGNMVLKTNTKDGFFSRSKPLDKDTTKKIQDEIRKKQQEILGRTTSNFALDAEDFDDDDEDEF